MLKLLGLLVLIPVIIIVSLPIALYQAWGLHLIWVWLAMPFLNLPEISILQIFVGLFVYHTAIDRQQVSSTPDILAVFITSIMRITFALGIAWLLKAIFIPWWFFGASFGIISP